MANINAFQFFNDRELTEPIRETLLDPVPVNEEAEKTIFLKNKRPEELRLNKVEVESANEDVKIKSFPSKVQGNGLGEITVTVKPSSDNLDGLKAQLKVDAEFTVVPD